MGYLLIAIAQTWILQRSPHRNHMSRTPAWPRIPTSGGKDTQRHQGRERVAVDHGESQIGRLWSGGATYQHKVATKYVCRNSILDGTGGHTAGWI